MTVYDEIAETDGDNECRTWIRRVFDSRDEIVAFATSRWDPTGGKTGEFVSYLKGSFNLSLRITFGDGETDAIIRFPKPGQTFTAFADEKLANEVQIMKFLGENTSIPLPRLVSWGLTEESPQQLGPFIIMNFVHGIKLSTFLKKPTKDDQEDAILNPEINTAILDTIYNQLADYMFQLSNLDFSSIGSISKNPASDLWSVSKRPLTYNMNELATGTGYPIHEFPTSQFRCVDDYFLNLASEHQIHFRAQRNIAYNPEEAERQFLARYRFKQLIPFYSTDNTGPFKLFCDDLQPSNMLIDPETLQITAMIDFEYTNAMPAQFAYDPPWWLLLLGPDMWLERYSIEEFLSLYEPKMEQFLRAMERVEAISSIGNSKQPNGPCLSTRMRDSWRSKRFWFDYGIRKSMDIDAVYWAALHDGTFGVESLDDETRTKIDSMKILKMEQLKAYKQECATRFE